MTHTLKIWPGHFEVVACGAKTVEVRREDDRHFEVGDVLVLREFVETDMDLFDTEPTWIPAEGGSYTGHTCTVVVTHVLRDPESHWLQPGVVALSVGAVEGHDE